MEKRIVFRSAWLPYALVAPQIAITIVFFFWPAGQAVWYSFQLQDAFGLKTQFVGLQNFAALFRDDNYLDVVQGHGGLQRAGRVLGDRDLAVPGASWPTACCAGPSRYKTLLIWPYAVAPAIAGVLWVFMFAPSLGIVAHVLQGMGVDWNPMLNGNHAMMLVVMASVWKQISYNFLFFLAGLQSIPQFADRGRGDRRRGTGRGGSGPSSFRCCRRPRSSCWWSTSSTRSSRPSASSTPRRGGGPAQATADPRVQGLSRRRQAADLGGSAAQSVILMLIVIVLTVDPVPLHRAQGAVLMVENRPLADRLSHLVLILGVLCVAFPLYVTFVASTLTLQDRSCRSPMPLIPGDQLVENYSQVLSSGSTRRSRRAGRR